MKRVLLNCLIVFITLQINAQGYEYVPFAREGVQWVYYEIGFYRANQRVIYYAQPFTLEFKGDSTLNGHTYKKLISAGQDYTSGKYYESCIALVRQYGNKYYARNCNHYLHPLQGYYTVKINSENRYDVIDYLIYDFDDVQGGFDVAPISVSDRESYFTFDEPEYVEVGGKLRKRYNTATPYRYLIEGIGYIQDCDKNLYEYIISNNDYDFTKNENSFYLSVLRNNPSTGDIIQLNPREYATFVFSHVIENGQVVYKGMLYKLFNKEEDSLLPDGIDDVKAASAGESRMYDLQGRALNGEPATPGIYVKDGKKVLVK